MSQKYTNLIDEAEVLVQHIGLMLDDCYTEHPNLGDIPKSGTPPLMRRLKQVRYRAQRRLNRRKAAAGIPLSINGAMWMINQADAGYF